MENLVIEIGANTREFLAGLKEVGESTEHLGDRLKSIGVVAAAAFAGYTAAIMGSVYAYREEEKIGLEVQAILQSTGGVAGVTAKAIDEMAESLAKSTTFSKGQVMRGEELLLTFTRIGKDIFPLATQATLDLAQRMGGDTAGAAQALGKALEDPAQGLTRLSRAGVLFTAQQKAQIETMYLSGNVAGAQALILKQVESSIGGMAQAAAGGTGALSIMKNQMEELAARIGEQFAPYVIAGAKAITGLIVAAKENAEIVRLGADILATGAIVSGTIATLAGAASAWGLLSAGIKVATGTTLAFGTAAKIAMGATGLGLLVVVALEAYQHWAVVWPAMQEIYRSFVTTITSASAGLAKVINGALHLNIDDVKAGIAQAAQAFIDGAKKTGGAVAGMFKATPEARQVAEETGRTLAQIEAASRIKTEQAEQDRLNKLKRASQVAGNQAIILEMQGHTAKLVALQKQESADLKILADSNQKATWAAVQKHLTEVRALYTAEEKNETNQRATFNKLTLKNSEQFSTAELAQLKGSIQTEADAKHQNALDDLNFEIQAHNTLLQEQERFGAAYAAINQAMHSKIATGTASAFSEMAQMTQSHSNTLKAIGKVAAIADIGIKTAQTAMNVYAGFSTIPIIGPALGIAAAAAAIAYGVERMSEVQAMAQGGLVTGGVPGIDSVPILAQQGELVVPKQNFNEVVDSVSMTRRGGSNGTGFDGAPQRVEVVISFQGSASKMLTYQINQDKALGRYRGTG